jgi:penicillin amidase
MYFVQMHPGFPVFMAVTTTAPPAHYRSRARFRRLRILLVLLAMALAAVTSGFYLLSRLALPQLDGRISLSGLGAQVTVTRNGQGVPAIAAKNLTDLFFAQGYVTAQDRLWQMDMTRRFAAGELAEVLGAKYVPHDRRQRSLLIRQAAENAAAQLSPRDRQFFEAYARGVNAYIHHQRVLPIEFAVLRYRPRDWTVTDSFLVAASMVQMLTLENLSHSLAREKISAMLPPELASDLFPNSSWRDRPPGSSPTLDEFVPPEEPEPRGKRAEPVLQPRQRRKAHRRRAAVPPNSSAATLFANWKVETGNSVLAPGSNNWVLSGTHTASGKPLLANDMHLPHHLPNVWYEAHLASGAYDVAGVTLPGVPFVIAGHNQRIAWGFTNLGATVTDLFVETFNGRDEYLTPDGWRPAQHRREVIRVRGGREQTVDIRITRHGPIVSGLEPPASVHSPVAGPIDSTRQLALKWTLYDPLALQVPLFDMNSAQNWDEFRRALSRFGSPAQNVTYADVDGHIAYQAAGMVPVRAAVPAEVKPASAAGTPVIGSDNAHEWIGYIPFDQLPSVLDPPSGIIATANGRITPDGYGYNISNEWGPPYRTERIYRVLASGKKFTPADMLALQNDIYSDFDRFCAQRFVYAVDRAANASARLRSAAELMRNWDGRIRNDSAPAAITAAASQELFRMLLEPRLGAAWQEYHWFMQPVWLENLLLHQPARWLPAQYATWDELLAAAVDSAIHRPGVPGDLKDWRWGEKNQLQIRHPVFGSLPILRRWAATGRVEQSGNALTVKQVSSRFGPSERMTVDLSDLDSSTLNIVNGQSGQIFSPYFNDQWRAWCQGHSFPLPFSAAAVERAKAHRLALEPAP